MTTCAFCQKRIGIIKKLRRKYFHAIVKQITPHGLLSYPKDIYFDSIDCIEKYQKSTGVKILN